MKARMPGRSKIHRGELALDWDFSLWFALLSPLIGFLFGIFEGFLVYH